MKNITLNEFAEGYTNKMEQLTNLSYSELFDMAVKVYDSMIDNSGIVTMEDIQTAVDVDEEMIRTAEEQERELQERLQREGEEMMKEWN